MFDLVKQNINIVRHIEKYTTLHQSGRTHHGLCPLHEDRESPSLHVYHMDSSFYCFGCLSANEPIRTENGLKKVQNVKVNDLVYDRYGSLQKVINTTSHLSKYPIHKIKLERFSNSNFLTANHKMIVVRKEIIDDLPIVYRTKRKNGERKLRFREYARNWIRTINLNIVTEDAPLFSVKQGDFMVFPCNVNVKNISVIDTSIYLKKYNKGPRLARVNLIPINEETMYMFGIYIAEGNTYRGGIRFSLNSNEDDIADRIRLGLSYIVPVDSVVIDKRENRNSSMEVRCSKTDLEIIFRELFGHGCQNKKFPYWFIHLGDNLKKSFLKGIFDGDGACDKRYNKSRNNTSNFMVNNTLEVTSKELVNSLMHICFSLKIPFSYSEKSSRVGKDGTIHANVYRLYLLGQQSYNFFYHLIDEELYAFMRVEENICTDEFPIVYDLTVENSHTFAMDKFVVNNCHRGGSVIDFEAYRQSISPVDAAKMLCEEYNLHPTYADSFKFQQNLQLRRKKESILESLENSLISRLEIYEYVKSRGLSPETIREFKLGCGLQTSVVVIPINDKFGRISGFARRNLDPNAKEKYVNDPSDAIYNKSEILFNYDKAKYYMKGKKAVILNEGYFDTMSLWEAGLKHSVAFCGSRITRNQAHVLQDIIDENAAIYLVPTNDKTAQEELEKNVAQIRATFTKNHIRTLVIPDDCKDLNDVLTKYGKGKILEIYEGSISIELYLVKRIISTEKIVEMQYTNASTDYH